LHRKKAGPTVTKAFFKTLRLATGCSKLNLQKSERKKQRRIWLFKKPERRTVQFHERTGKENW